MDGRLGICRIESCSVFKTQKAVINDKRINVVVNDKKVIPAEVFPVGETALGSKVYKHPSKIPRPCSGSNVFMCTNLSSSQVSSMGDKIQRLKVL